METQATHPKSTRPLTQAELDARRANARKSTGPKTPEGKARSSQNAIKHGFFAQTALLCYEAPDEFVALRDAYIAEYKPQSPTEMHFVMEMANAQFRLRRVRGIEASLILRLTTREIRGGGLSNEEIQAEAFRMLADSSSVIQLLQRYESMFRRQYERALRLLWEHRERLRRQAEAAKSETPKARARKSGPSGANAALHALHALLLAPSPGELPGARHEFLQNEPERVQAPDPAITSDPLAAGASANPRRSRRQAA